MASTRRVRLNCPNHRCSIEFLPLPRTSEDMPEKERHGRRCRDLQRLRRRFFGCNQLGQSFATSTAHGESLDQRLRKVGATHALLDDRNIVGHAPKLDDLVLQVGDGKSGARIAVTRLSDRTGVKEIAAREFDAQRCKRFVGARTNLKDLELRVLIGKTALVMCVPEESYWSGRVQEAVKGLRRSEDVFVFILKRAVNKHDAIRCERSRRQSRQPREVIRFELRTRPIHGRFCDRVEIISGHQSSDRFIMISPNGLRAKFAQARRDFVGIGAIADDITQADGKIPAAPSGIEDGVECSSVRVQVAENEDSHS